MATMRSKLEAGLAKAKLEPVADPIANFNTLFGVKKASNDHRMTGLYSYDIKDNQTYRKCQKIEEKLREKFAKRS